MERRKRETSKHLCINDCLKLQFLAGGLHCFLILNLDILLASCSQEVSAQCSSSGYWCLHVRSAHHFHLSWRWHPQHPSPGIASFHHAVPVLEEPSPPTPTTSSRHCAHAPLSVVLRTGNTGTLLGIPGMSGLPLSSPVFYQATSLQFSFPFFKV